LVVLFAAGTVLRAGTAFFADVPFFTAMLGPFMGVNASAPKKRTGGVRIRPSCSVLKGETPLRLWLVRPHQDSELRIN